jgi:hypothetical protein
MKPVTFRLVARCVNQLRYRVAQSIDEDEQASIDTTKLLVGCERGNT